MLEVSLDDTFLKPSSFCDLDADPLEITYVSAPCSAGKTHALAHLMKGALSREPFDEPVQFLYVAPTKRLLEEFSQRLTDIGSRRKRLLRVYLAKTTGSLEGSHSI